jgi:hypothetical protein
LFLLTASATLTQAQVQPILSNKRTKKIAVTFPVQYIDTVSIIPNTFSVANIDASQYRIDYVNATLRWITKPAVDSIDVFYRAAAIKFNAEYKKLDYSKIDFNNTDAPSNTIINTEKQSLNPFLNLGKIKTDGVFGRSVAFGNSQDAVVNSTLNFQLSGYIGDSIEISAAITDNNIPIQPEGNTKDLRDFDRIYFQAKKKNWQVGLGDIDIRETENYFLNFYKRLQGIQVVTKHKFGKNIDNKTQLAGAIAKGKFTRNILTPLEGNQGPYRLNSANGELYFVILANTERVFIDGQLMQRGEDQDYVISYNTAEITFTSKRIITKDLRIQVEFEYNDRNYLNSQLYVNTKTSFGKKFQLGIGAYSNADSRNSSIDQSLDDDQKKFLATVGDSVQNAFYPSAFKDTFSLNKILYRKVDSIVGAIVYPNVYVLTNNPNDIPYSLSFTNVGINRGNYVQVFNANNGKTFKWVAPLAGVPQGDWEPVTLLVAPKKIQVVNLTASMLLHKNDTAIADIALSNFDANLFSRIDKANNSAMATKLRYGFGQRQLNLFKQNIGFSAGVNYENVNQNFRAIERLRTVEFYRDWGLPFIANAATEQLYSGNFKLIQKANQFEYSATNYTRNDGYKGLQQNILSKLVFNKTTIQTGASYTNYNAAQEKGFFLRPTILVQQNFGGKQSISVVGRYFGEYNKTNNKITNNVAPNSFGFSVSELTVSGSSAAGNRWQLGYMTRADLVPFTNTLTKANHSDNFSLGYDFLSSEKHKVKLTTSYRILKIDNDIVSNVKADNTALGRVEYYINELNGFINGTALYEIGAGQEQKREYSFLEVQAGQGQYTWLDYNQNGIQELNEFEEAIFADQKKYVKIFTPTNEFVKANYLQFNYAIDINPRQLIKSTDATKWKRIARRFNVASSLQIAKKEISNNDLLYNPFSSSLVDSTLISSATFFSNTLFYNRASAKFGVELTRANRGLKQILNFGLESQKVISSQAKVRASVIKNTVAAISYKNILNELASNAVKFNNRNYKVEQHIIEPSVTYNYKSNFVTTLTYSLGIKENKIENLEKVTTNALTADVRYSILSNSRISGKFSYNNIKFDANTGSANSTVGFLLLDALLPGKNYIWQLDFTKRFAGNIEFTLQYDGRKAGITKPIHRGSASIRAFF